MKKQLATTDKTIGNSQIALAVEAIKAAILQGQYEASKDVNRIQLGLYFAVGRYLSFNTRKGVWGTGVLGAISEKLRKELPGLRGFSETQMKDMRRFYEAWQMLDSNMTVTTAEINNEGSTASTEELIKPISAVATAELRPSVNKIDIFNTLHTLHNKDFPIENFFKVPFTHHSRIIIGVKELRARYYYITRVANEHLSVESLKRLIADKTHLHVGTLPNNFNQTITNPNEARKAVMMFKDEYFEFHQCGRNRRA